MLILNFMSDLLFKEVGLGATKDWENCGIFHNHLIWASHRQKGLFVAGDIVMFGYEMGLFKMQMQDKTLPCKVQAIYQQHPDIRPSSLSQISSEMDWWKNGKVFFGLTSPHFKRFLEIMEDMYFRLKRKRKFRSQHLWRYGGISAHVTPTSVTAPLMLKGTCKFLEQHMLPPNNSFFRDVLTCSSRRMKPHSVPLTAAWLKNMFLDWPADSSDLSPIETVWCITVWSTKYDNRDLGLLRDWSHISNMNEHEHLLKKKWCDTVANMRFSQFFCFLFIYFLHMLKLIRLNSKYIVFVLYLITFGFKGFANYYILLPLVFQISILLNWWYGPGNSSLMTESSHFHTLRPVGSQTQFPRFIWFDYFSSKLNPKFNKCFT